MHKIMENNKTSKYDLYELPFTEDENILEYTHLLQHLHDIMHNLTLEIVARNEQVKTSIGFIVSLLDRIRESFVSIAYLSLKGLHRDVAIILLNLIELRTDLKYISENPHELTKWFEHKERYKKPWPFSKQLKDIGTEEDKRIYEICSMAKHGNPVGLDIGFNCGLSGKNLFLNDSSVSRINEFLYWTYYYGADSIESSFEILKVKKMNFEKTENNFNQFKEVSRSITSKLLERRILDLVNLKNK